MLYQLMNRDVVVTYEETVDLGIYLYTKVEQLDAYLPYGSANINAWIDDRQIAKHRSSIERFLRAGALSLVTTSLFKPAASPLPTRSG